MIPIFFRLGVMKAEFPALDYLRSVPTVLSTAGVLGHAWRFIYYCNADK